MQHHQVLHLQHEASAFLSGIKINKSGVGIFEIDGTGEINLVATTTIGDTSGERHLILT